MKSITCPENKPVYTVLFQLCFRLFGFGILRQSDRHRPMLWAMRRADVANVGSGDPDEITAPLDVAFGFEHARLLFLFPISRPAIIGPTIDCQTGMRQRPQ